MSMYFVGDDPLLIPLVCQTYLSFDHFRTVVDKGLVHIIVPHKNYPHHWIDMGGRYDHTSTLDTNLDSYLFLDGKKFPLPFRKRRLFQLSNVDLRETLRSYYLSKIRMTASSTTGMGGEERTYKDWVIRRYGSKLYSLLFEPLIKNRYNLFARHHNILDIGEELSSGFARDWHLPQKVTWKSYHFKDNFVPKNIQIHEVGSFLSLERKGSNWLLNSRNGKDSIQTVIENPHFAMTPQKIFSLLDTSLVTSSLGVDVKYLHCQSMQRTSFLANNVSKQCVWGVDVGVPHQVLSDGEYVQVSYQSCGEETLDHERLRGQLASIDIDIGPATCHQEYKSPVWTQQSHFRFRRFADTIDKWNTKLVGNYGLFGHLRFADQMFCLVESLKESNAEIIRKYVEPIVKSPEKDVKMENVLYQF